MGTNDDFLEGKELAAAQGKVKYVSPEEKNKIRTIIQQAICDIQLGVFHAAEAGVDIDDLLTTLDVFVMKNRPPTE